jgi:hypothetical protein
MALRNDPVLSEDEGRVVYFTINATNSRLQLHDQERVEIDFKKEVEKNLSKFIDKQLEKPFERPPAIYSNNTPMKIANGVDK